VTSDNASAVARICRVLDGMPLAIELAAARMRTMAVAQLAERLDDRFRLLIDGSRTAVPRHQTLRAAIDWSWELLPDAERVLLRRLAVFTGGATQEAVQRVCADAVVTADQVPDLVAALVDKSLLVVSGDEIPRYRMLETIKAYGLERLDEAGEREALRRAHATYFVNSPRPPSHTCAALNSWSGCVGSKPTTTTSTERFVGRSRPTTRRPRCASSQRPVGIGGSAATRRRPWSWRPRHWPCRGGR
jgi:predicted ATPase